MAARSRECGGGLLRLTSVVRAEVADGAEQFSHGVVRPCPVVGPAEAEHGVRQEIEEARGGNAGGGQPRVGEQCLDGVRRAGPVDLQVVGPVEQHPTPEGHVGGDRREGDAPALPAAHLTEVLAGTEALGGTLAQVQAPGPENAVAPSTTSTSSAITGIPDRWRFISRDVLPISRAPSTPQARPSWMNAPAWNGARPSQCPATTPVDAR